MAVLFYSRMKNKWFYIIGGVLLMAALIPTGYLDILKTFFTQWEGFRSRPYWDVNRWSWGYGTKVPGSISDKSIIPAGSITRIQAWQDSTNFVQSDYRYLSSLVKVPLNPNQWAALLSFSYNTGRGNAANLISYINAGNKANLAYQWSRYVYAGGIRNANLVARRAAEWALFNK